MADTVVYWTCIHFNLVAPDIDHATRDLMNLVNQMSEGSDPGESVDIKACPAVTDHLKNTFRVRNNICYDITRTDKGFFTEQKDKDFWDRFVNIRDVNTGLLSFYFAQHIFFTEEDSLVMEFKHPVYANNSFSNNAQLVEGCYDIGKWFRNTDLAFFVKEKNKKITIEHEDVIFYVKFLTDKKIKLKKFYMSPELIKMRDEILSSRGVMIEHARRNGVMKGILKYYYNFKQSHYKSRIIREIKNNLME